MRRMSVNAKKPAARRAGAGESGCLCGICGCCKTYGFFSSVGPCGVLDIHETARCKARRCAGSAVERGLRGRRRAIRGHVTVVNPRHDVPAAREVSALCEAAQERGGSAGVRGGGGVDGGSHANRKRAILYSSSGTSTRKTYLERPRATERAVSAPGRSQAVGHGGAATRHAGVMTYGDGGSTYAYTAYSSTRMKSWPCFMSPTRMLVPVDTPPSWPRGRATSAPRRHSRGAGGGCRAQRTGGGAQRAGGDREGRLGGGAPR